MSCVKTSSDYLCLTSTHNSQTFSVFTSIYIPSPNNFKFILFVLKSCFDSIIFHKFLLLHVLPINQTFFQYFHPSHESSYPCCDHMHSISLPSFCAQLSYPQCTINIQTPSYIKGRKVQSNNCTINQSIYRHETSHPIQILADSQGNHNNKLNQTTQNCKF